MRQGEDVVQGRQRLRRGEGVGHGVEQEQGQGERQAGYGGLALQRKACVARAGLVASSSSESVKR
jgi:hypothetical protein